MIPINTNLLPPQQMNIKLRRLPKWATTACSSQNIDTESKETTNYRKGNQMLTTLKRSHRNDQQKGRKIFLTREPSSSDQMLAKHTEQGMQRKRWPQPLPSDQHAGVQAL